MSSSPSTFTRIVRVAQALEGRLEADLDGMGLSQAQLNVLRILADAGEPVALSTIAERFGCVRSNVTQLVDRLEVDGLVRRVDDPDDRRVTRAALTPAGRRAHRDGIRIVGRHEAAVVEALGEEAAALRRALDRLSD